MKVRARMTRNLVCVTPEDSLQTAFELMSEGGFRHLPVVEEGTLVGILSERDVLLAAEKNDDGTVSIPASPVREAMTPDPVTCRPSASLADVAAVMIEKKIDSIPVTGVDAELLGMVTSTDLLELVCEKLENFGLHRLPVNYHVAMPTESLEDALRGIQVGNFRQRPVTT